MPAGVKRVVQIHAGQHGEHVSLQKSDEQLEGVEPDDHGEGQDGGRLQDNAGAKQHDDESAEHVERDVARQHVGEKTDRVAHRPDEKGEDLDRDYERQNVDRHARGNEETEKMPPVILEADEDNREKDEQRERGGDDDLAHHREGIGNEPDDVGDENEEENAEHQRKEAHSRFARRRAQHTGHEFVAHLGHGLHAPRNAGAAACADGRDKTAQRNGQQHVEAGIGQRKVDMADRNRQDRMDRELLDRIDRRSRVSSHVA